MNLHPKTNRPVQPHATFEVGEVVTENFLGDSTPAVVVHVTAKTVFVRRVNFIAEIEAVGTGHEDTDVVADPEDIEAAVAAGKDGARKYVLRVAAKPTHGSFNDRERFTEDGGTFHRSGWKIPGSTAGSLTKGARTRRDPHV